MMSSYHASPDEPLPRFHLSLLRNGREEEIWMFIHGYAAATGTREVKTLRQHILRAQTPGLAYLANWNAGNWKVPWAGPIVRNSWRLCRAGQRMHPAGFAADAGLWLAGQAWQYRHYARKADRVGRALPRRLAALSRTRDWPVHLVGHSLGTRVIQSALIQDDCRDINLRSVWLLGGAADADSEGWEKAASNVSGTVYNAYSKSDFVIGAIPDRRKRIGCHPIAAPQIVNISCEGFRHGDYWPRLGELISRPHVK